jgi:hypothetical protein
MFLLAPNTKTVVSQALKLSWLPIFLHVNPKAAEAGSKAEVKQ